MVLNYYVSVLADKEISICNKPIILYRGDCNVELQFEFRHIEDIINEVGAKYAQLLISMPDGDIVNITKVNPITDGKIIVNIIAQYIDEIIEIGDYDFQIRLFDEAQIARLTIPPVLKGIRVREPIVSDSNADVSKVDEAYLLAVSEPEETFIDGSYNKTAWELGDIITSPRMNKIEDGIYQVNEKVNSRFENIVLKDELEKINNLEESVASEVVSESDFITVENTSNGYFSDIKLEGKTLILNADNEVVEAGTEGVTLKSVGQDVDEISVLSTNKEETKQDKKRILYYNDETQTWEKPILRQWDSIEKHSDGKYYYHKRSGEVVLNGSEGWTLYSNGESSTNYIGFRLAKDDVTGSQLQTGIKGISDKFNYIENYTDIHAGLKEGLCCGYNAIAVGVNRTKLSTQDVAGFKAWLQANPVTVVYQLAQEKVYECTNLDLITYADETNLVIKSGVLNPKVTLKVKKGIGNVVTMLQNKVSQLTNDKGCLTEHQSLAGYATEDYVTDKIAEAQLNGGGSNVDLSEYAKKSEIPTVPANISAFNNDAGYLKAIPGEYITESELNAKGYLTKVPDEYVTDTELNNKGYLTQHQSLESYATKTYVDNKLGGITRIEVVDELPGTEETGVLYIVKGK